jgi:hypothetical protein
MLFVGFFQIFSVKIDIIRHQTESKKRQEGLYYPGKTNPRCAKPREEGLRSKAEAAAGIRR